ncbi:uncharacterized protein SOCEGT47_056980 [Sorangium cellulosum]|uniref:Uncharacterized protein n=1 Tax=Sorangium cellulosum TaxID=56 RepID=A0A4P2Q6N3_SORCE|nr:hypothetical protein [Sorangium cellulosum]AUX25154.1 uncharacterized protein SOCEGT47_056980 [Sorangium cellulosum]
MSDIAEMQVQEEVHAEREQHAKDPAVVALEKELEAEREALAAAEAKRERDRQAAVLREQIEETRRRRKEEEALAEAEARHGPLGKKIEAVQTIEGLVIVKAPDGIKARKWMDQHGENPKAQACRELARPCVVYPSLDRFDEIIAERPVVVVSTANAVLKLAGLGGKELGGK